MKYIILIASLLFTFSSKGEEPKDTLVIHNKVDGLTGKRVDDSINKKMTAPRFGYSFNVNPSIEVKLDKLQKKWMKKNRNFSIGAELHYSSLPQDSDAFASDYGYPLLTFGAKYSFNHGVVMHRDPDPAWGQAQEVDYNSKMGNTISVYGAFSRPFFRRRHWETDYTFYYGVSYSHRKYNQQNSIDNELIGSRWLIFFGMGLHATYHFSHNWGMRVGLEYWHLSNGALNRPNKGANFIGPSVALVYQPYYEQTETGRAERFNPPFKKKVYMNVALGIGGKTLHEDWQLTQFQTPEGEADYRTDKFKCYAGYSLQTDVMYRYARRWASGIGIDLFYGSYWKRVKELDQSAGSSLSHSPWSVGIAAKHEIFYHNFSMPVSLGFYVFRKMGENAKLVEQPFYERIGVHYSFARLKGLKVGINIKAHLTKADLTELVVTYPIGLK